MNKYERACQYLKCTACGKPDLRYEESRSALACSACSAAFAVRDGVIQFLEEDDYVANFSRQWEMDAPLDPWSVPEFIQQTGILPAEWQGKIIVDAGCGKGKSETYLSRFVSDDSFVIAFDLSHGVFRAARAFAECENIVFVQARFEQAPIRSSVADIVLAKGTLMHSPDPETSFDRMADLVKVGGKLVVELYPADGGFVWERRWRRLTRKLSEDTNVRIAWVLAHVVYHLHHVPLLRRLLALFPVTADRNPEQRFANTFDVISPRYAWRMPAHVVDYWYRKNGFRLVQLLQASVDCVGERLYAADEVPPIPVYFRPTIARDEHHQIIYPVFDNTTFADGDEHHDFTPGYRHERRELDH